MVSYELCKDGSAIISGNANSALVGGLLFGTVGAVAGAAGSSKDVNKYCSEMYISIVDMNARRYRLFLITEPVLESSVDYKVAIEQKNEQKEIYHQHTDIHPTFDASFGECTEDNPRLGQHQRWWPVSGRDDARKTPWKRKGHL